MRDSNAYKAERAAKKRKEQRHGDVRDAKAAATLQTARCMELGYVYCGTERRHGQPYLKNLAYLQPTQF